VAQPFFKETRYASFHWDMDSYKGLPKANEATPSTRLGAGTLRNTFGGPLYQLD